ncbi:MAG TPA: ABC transporter substrate-binding protein [Rhizomicrobium sp.]|nr:ABC transporter substrate-binding protein [Rhizomicrobium sp.]
MKQSIPCKQGRVAGAIRLLALAAIVAIAMPLAAARASTPAEDFVQNNVQKGLTILNSGGTKEQKREDFRNFLLKQTDLKRIADYTLGPVKNSTSPADLAAFEDAFREYAFAVYESEFTKYSGQTLKVTGSVERKAGDYLVSTVLIDPNKSSDRDPIRVDFRILGTPGRFTVADIIVLGLDLAITEQDDFSAFLAQNNNSVKALTEELKKRAANVRAGGDLSGK